MDSLVGWSDAGGPLRLQAASTNWFADAVWYQIFPERFRNGDPANDPTPSSLAGTYLTRCAGWLENHPVDLGLVSTGKPGSRTAKVFTGMRNSVAVWQTRASLTSSTT